MGGLGGEGLNYLILILILSFFLLLLFFLSFLPCKLLELLGNNGPLPSFNNLAHLEKKKSTTDVTFLVALN